MHIKQVIIEGFKSFKGKSIVEPFDKRHNVIVGRNGSGKSNFFNAIQFVLSDEFTHLKPEARQQLLHECTGDQLRSAYVEIILDNADNRIPIDKDEIFVRRVIGAKMDQYLLNGKVVSRTDIVNILQSATFSISNPYYIVKQGKINEMATAPDKYRYKLLCELAGTRIYDERKEETMKTLRDNMVQLEQIAQFLQTIDERLKTLETEKNELEEFKKWNNARRTLEYLILKNELKNDRTALGDLDNQRKLTGDKQNQLNVKVREAQENIKDIKKSLKDANNKVSAAEDEKSLFIHEHQTLLREKARLDLTLIDLTDEIQGDSKLIDRATNELDPLKATIEEKENELNELRPQYDAMKRKEEECCRELSLKGQKRKELHAKQGRKIQFSSREERDQWIQNELESLSQQIADKISHHNKLIDDLKSDATRQLEFEGKIEQLRAEKGQLRVQIDEENNQYYDLKKNKDSHQATRNDLWRKETQMTTTLSLHKEELAKVDRTLRSMAGKAIFDGSDSVRKVVQSFFERDGPDAAKAYYGTVIENFNCKNDMYSAIEVTAGDCLFHHVVESSRVANKILSEMNKLKLPGVATFLPLDSLTAKTVNYVDDPDSFSMISKMKYEYKIDKALRYIFGKTLICRNFQRAYELAKSTGFDCVTLEGDLVSSKGCFSGGYISKDRSIMEMQKRRTEHTHAMKDLDDTLGPLRNELQTIEASINMAVSEMQKIETKREESKDIFDKVRADIRLMKEEMIRIERFRSQKEHSLSQCKLDLQAMNSAKEGFESELNQDLMSQLSSQDQLDVNQLNNDIRRLNQENKEAFSARVALEVIKTKLETTLTNHLFRRRKELLQALKENSIEDRKCRLQICRTDVVDVDERISKVTNYMQAADKKVQEGVEAQKMLQKDLERWRQTEKEVQDQFLEDSKKPEKWAAKENLLRQKIDECTEKIAELGALPQVNSSYTEMSLINLNKEFARVRKNLRKYTDVNKKAVDQFHSLYEQNELLCKRKEELDLADRKIGELMQALEVRRNETIQVTFDQLAKNFTEVFKKLVPQGCGYLELKTRANDSSESEDEVTNADDVLGIGVRVSFLSSAEADMRGMHQLSGGQKSMVALTLIFSMQKCNPAPFYLFDEVDQALDAPHRRAVGDMIHELSDSAQFITTTFRPELIERAHKFYGVRFHNKVSHVDCVAKEKARDFVDDEEDQSQGRFSTYNIQS